MTGQTDAQLAEHGLDAAGLDRILAACDDYQQALINPAVETGWACADLRNVTVDPLLIGLMPSTGANRAAAAPEAGEVELWPDYDENWGGPIASVTGLAGVTDACHWGFAYDQAYGTTRKGVIGTVNIEARTALDCTNTNSNNYQRLTKKSGPNIDIGLRWRPHNASNNNAAGSIQRADLGYFGTSLSDRKYYTHPLGANYYLSFNQYVRPVGQPNPSRYDGYYHFKPVHSAVFECPSARGSCRFPLNDKK